MKVRARAEKRNEGGVNKTWNMEHPGTSMNIPEHPGTCKNKSNFHKKN